MFAILGEKKRVLLKQGCDCINKIKTKPFQSLPIEEMSMLQAIKCVHYRVFYSSWVNEIIIRDIFLQDNGWIVDKENEEVRSLWFTGTFLISFVHFHISQQI